MTPLRKKRTTARPKASEPSDAPAKPPARERLIDAAVEEFAAHGLDGASIGAIADKAQINKQLVFHYFGSKNGLFETALERVFMRSRERDEGWLEDLELLPPDRALRSFIKHMCTTTWNSIFFQRIVMEDALRGAAALRNRPAVAERYDRLIEALRMILRRGAQAGLFRQDVDPRELYVSLMGLYGVRFTNAATVSLSIRLDLNTPQGFERSSRWVSDFVFAALRP